jgi:phenylalanyl-tRNA synthetase beta chain
MPTIAVDKAALLKALEKEYTTEEFDELCFEFGLELDEDTSQSTKPEDLAQPAQLKIEIPANRYDMLCFEGIAMNLRVFLQKEKLPKWSLTSPASGELETLTIKEEVWNTEIKMFGRVGTVVLTV